MDNDHLSGQEEITEINQLNTSTKPKQRARRRRARKQNLESQLEFFRESRLTEEIEKGEKPDKTIDFFQVIFLIFTITPLFFSLAIFLSKTVLRQQPEEITTTKKNELPLLNTRTKCDQRNSNRTKNATIT